MIYKELDIIGKRVYKADRREGEVKAESSEQTDLLYVNGVLDDVLVRRRGEPRALFRREVVGPEQRRRRQLLLCYFRLVRPQRSHQVHLQQHRNHRCRWVER